MNRIVTNSGLKLEELFPFALDDFQYQAIAALEAGRSVVVCAPTGSGKTLIGEYAIHRALANRRRVFYTTPLKALSNQKLRDFRELFGAEQVGLLTGDTSINRDAPVVVMTTEIFRNMLYGTEAGEVGTSLMHVEAVVLDECHYMNDRQRGTVWEESIIYCPPEIQLVALSATVANSEQLTDWIQQVHGPTERIYSDYRPVPLQFSFCSPKGLFPLLDESQKKIHPSLKQRLPKHKGNFKGGRKPRQETPTLGFVLNHLQQKDMLPAIYFIFSRKGCDQAVSEASRLPLTLVTEAESSVLRQRVQDFLAANPEAGRAGQIEPLCRGIAAHHAGILPAWKSLIEELFQDGLIKVVFATETLAAGINMPARTTVISNLSKRTDMGHRLLNASEFLQMAGRAGRRGMDVQGYVVAVQSPFEGAKEAAYLATSGADPLVSQFAPTYGMVLNLLQTHTLEEARELIERSFGQYLATLYLRPQQEAIEVLEAELAQLIAQIGSVDWTLLAQYEKLQDRLREEKRILKLLQTQANDVRVGDMAAALQFAVAGTILCLQGTFTPNHAPLPATLVTKIAGAGQFPYLICLGSDNRWYVATVADVIALRGEIPRIVGVDSLHLPSDLPPKPGQSRSGTPATQEVVHRIPPVVAVTESNPEIYEYLQRVNAVQSQLEDHPVHQWGNLATLLKRRKRMNHIQHELADRKEKLARQTQRRWEEFLALIDILQQFGCIQWVNEAEPDTEEAATEEPRPTDLGQIVAAIRGDNELWLGLAFASGQLDTLEPQHLAAACAALAMEVSRPDVWTHYAIPPEVEQAVGGLRSIRRRLFQQQRRYEVGMPVWMELEFTGLITQWALGEDWLELCSHTNLDEGDVVRILRRTLDVLTQIPYIPHLPTKLKQKVEDAIRMLDRFPVSGTVE